MLQKSKSKQVKLVKYALLIPLVLGMLIYTSCDKEKDTDALNLEQYTYTIKKPEDLVGEVKKAHEKYETFLKANNDKYVSWAQVDNSIGITYSVHPIEEKVPENLTRSGVYSKDGSSYVIYIDFGQAPQPPPLNESEESKRLKEEELLKLKEKYKDSSEIPYAVIENVPTFSGCENLVSNEEKRKCTSEKMQEFVGKNFNTKIGKENGLTGKQRITVLFKIDTEGSIVEVQSRAPHPALEAEAIRVVNSFPKMQPGKQRGKAAVVPYSLPIVFVVK